MRGGKGRRKNKGRKKNLGTSSFGRVLVVMATTTERGSRSG